MMKVERSDWLQALAILHPELVTAHPWPFARSDTEDSVYWKQASEIEIVEMKRYLASPPRPAAHATNWEAYQAARIEEARRIKTKKDATEYAAARRAELAAAEQAREDEARAEVQAELARQDERGRALEQARRAPAGAPLAGTSWQRLRRALTGSASR